MEKISQAAQLESAPDEKYNFPEIESFKEGLFDMCEKMKGDIETNKWDVLLSDETGGRVPTLVIWNLIKHFHPSDPPKPYFLSSGLTYKPNTTDEVLDEHEFLKKITNPDDRCLIVTQFIRTGKTMRSMISSLEMTGVKRENIDVASVVSDYPNEELYGKLGQHEGEIYSGERRGAHSADVEAFYPRFTGVIQDHTHYSPTPIKLTEDVKNTGQRGKLIGHDEWKRIFDIQYDDMYEKLGRKVSNVDRMAEYTKRNNTPLSVEEEKELQGNVNKAREDVATLTREILKKIWSDTSAV